MINDIDLYNLILVKRDKLHFKGIDGTLHLMHVLCRLSDLELQIRLTASPVIYKRAVNYAGIHLSF